MRFYNTQNNLKHNIINTYIVIFSQYKVSAAVASVSWSAVENIDEGNYTSRCPEIVGIMLYIRINIGP